MYASNPKQTKNTVMALGLIGLSSPLAVNQSSYGGSLEVSLAPRASASQNIDATTLCDFGTGVSDTTYLASYVDDINKPEPETGKYFPKEKVGSNVKVFDDFEEPELTVKNWTVKGDCWGESLANSGKAFNLHFPKYAISQFEGKSFVISLNRTGTEIGKATSVDFIISTDKISFDIAGGAGKNTAFKLVVDGKTERVANGDNDLIFRRKSFKTKDFVGKTAHFEIVDAENEKNSATGVIAIDNIREERSVTNSKATIYVPLWGGNGIAPLPFFERSLEAKRQIEDLNFGVSSKSFELLVNKIYLGMCSADMDHQSHRSVDATAQLIRKKVESIVSTSQVDLSDVGKQWALAEGIGAWVRIHVKDWTELRQPGMVKEEYIDSSYMLRMPVPKGVCSGFSVMVRDLSKSAGLTCYSVIGIFKDFGGVAPQRDNHEWNMFVFSGGVRVPMDASQTRVDADKILTRKGKIYRHWVLPKTPAEMELFLCTRYGRNSRDSVDVKEIDLNNMDFIEWAGMPTADEGKLRDFCNKSEDAFNRSR